jgi:hypothetical protein
MTVVPVLSDVAAASVSGRRAEVLVGIDLSVDVMNVLTVVLDVVIGERAPVVNGSTTDEIARLVSEDLATPTDQRMRGETLDLNRAAASGENGRTDDRTIVSTVVRSGATTASADVPRSITLARGMSVEGNHVTVSRGLRDQT